MTAIEVLAGLAVMAALLVIRYLALVHGRGNIFCCVRDSNGTWRSGVARYAGGELHWIPFLGLRLRPRHAIARRGLIICGRRRLNAGEGPEGFWSIDCHSEGRRVSLAMSEEALTGFLAWLEAAPPSAHLDAA